MKNSLLIIAFAFSLIANSQTSLIAFKSHSGNSFNYVLDPSFNFGRIEHYYHPEIIVNDTLKVSQRMDYIADTLINDTVKMTELEIIRFHEMNLQRFRDSISEAQNDSVPFQLNESSPSKIQTKSCSVKKGNFGWWLVLGVVGSFFFVKKVAADND